MRTLFLLIILAGFTNPASTTAQSADSVNISGISRRLAWTGQPKKFELIPNGIIIESGPKTDMYRAPDHSYNVYNAPHLMLKADTCFILSARIQHNFDNKWDGGAILIEEDSLNWIKFCFEKDYKEQHRVVSVVTKSISDDCNSLAFATNDVYYRVARVHDVIYLYCSGDGGEWYLVRTLNFPSKQDLKVGFLAQSPEGANNRVTFTNIQYKPVRVKDFWKGE
ncbi:MAG TPA: DUF1349 domain-containing protein [Saprospiraceae bacterium]|nr:DUF1349 domain-containing protein [Saprospiraceae bacterium]